MAPRTEVVWTSDVLASQERCVISDMPGPSSIEGTAALALHNRPASIAYQIDTAADWSVVGARTIVTSGAGERTILIERAGDDWLVDTLERPDLRACTSVDLGWSPATNTLPLRAAPLGIGESRTSWAAWLRFPELDVVASEQTYTRLAADRVRYTSATFTAELVMTELDVVTTYGDALWQVHRLRHYSAAS